MATSSKITKSCLNYIILLSITLFVLVKLNGSVKTLPSDPINHILQCNKSKLDNSNNKMMCFINSKIIVEVQYFFVNFIAGIQFYCYNATPLRISLPPEQNFSWNGKANSVTFNSCRFLANDNILEILTQSLQLTYLRTVIFDGTLINNNSLSRTALKGLDKFLKEGLVFMIKNVSTLPTDLFADVENLKALEIHSNSISSLLLADLLAALKNLRMPNLHTNSLEGGSKGIFANQIYLSSLKFKCYNITNQRTYKLEKSIPDENRVVVKQLPDGLFRDLRSLSKVHIMRCQLESISPDTFINLTRVAEISITDNCFYELPLRLFADQKKLVRLDLSKNEIRKLVKGLFDCNEELKRLDLSGNQLTNLPKDIFKNLRNLRTLKLDNNNLLAFSSYDNQQHGFKFAYLRNLETLSLKNNSIHEIPYSIMEGCKRLQVLDLRFNNIRSIKCTVGLSLGLIILEENPFVCDCKILCIYQQALQNNRNRQVKCDLPNALKDTFLRHLDVSDLLCYPDIHQGNASKRCSFDIRTADLVIVMNCSNRNLKDIPTPPILEQSFSNGIELYMDNNPLTELSPEILMNNANISLLSISNSLITKLPQQFLSNLKKLRTVIFNLPLENIPEDIFLQSTAIETLIISNTNIKEIPRLTFKNLQNLKNLDLSKNKLKRIENDEFQSNYNLRTLRLSHNSLVYLRPSIFDKLVALKELYLDNNLLKSLKEGHFRKTKSLQFVSMENNKLTTIKPFVRIETLQTLILKNNSIGNDFLKEIEQLRPSSLDLSSNKISIVDLSKLDSIDANKLFVNLSNNNIQTIKVKHGNISLNCSCDCKIISFKKDIKLKTVNVYESLQCLSQASPKHLQVSNLSTEDLLCPMKTVCPRRCQCWIRPINSTLIVNCSGSNFTKVPSLPALETIFQNGIELSIEYNQLTSLRPHSQSGYKGVTKIYAANNNITHISSEDIPQNITHLDVSYNRIESLDQKVMELMNDSQTLRSVLLIENRFKCDCSSQNLSLFILRNKALFPDNYQCADGRIFGTFLYTDFCFTEESNILTVTSIVLTVILFVLLVLSTWYFTNKEQIIVWMYAHNICLRWITEEELDKDKAYDAFVSYSSADEDLVADLVSKLESGPNPYKLCLHDRDWLGGGYIPYQIEKSVECSKRTIVVMTQNFMKSQWTRLELRTAHNASMNEKRSRVIVIIVGEVNIDNLDSDVRKYVKMYTYLKWGDPWFWERLGYAMPHRSKINEPSEQHKKRMLRNGVGSSGKRHPFHDETLF